MDHKDDDDDDDGNSDISEITFQGFSGISSSIWSLSDNSEHPSVDSDCDHTSSCGTDSSLNSLSSVHSNVSAQNDASIQGTPLDSEPHIENNGNSEPNEISEHSKPHIDNSGYSKFIENYEHSNLHSLENYFKSEGPEVDQEKSGQLKSIADSVDSNILAERKKDKQILVTKNHPVRPLNGKGPRNIKRNTGTNTVKSESNPEITNLINPLHKDNLAVSKQEDIDPSKISPEEAFGEMEDILLESLQINPEVIDNDTSQHEFTVHSIENISKIIDDASEYKRIKLRISTASDSLVDYSNGLSMEDAVIINLYLASVARGMLPFIKGGGDVHEENVGDDERDSDSITKDQQSGTYFQSRRFLPGEVTHDTELDDSLKILANAIHKIPSTLKGIRIKKAFHKAVYDEEFKKTIDGLIRNGQSWLVPSQADVELTVGMVNTTGSKLLPTARDGNSDGEDEDSGEDGEEDSHQSANTNTGENPTAVQQSGATINGEL